MWKKKGLRINVEWSKKSGRFDENDSLRKGRFIFVFQNYFNVKINNYIDFLLEEVEKDHGAEEKAGPGQEVEEEEGKLFKLKQKFYLKISIIFY